MWQLYIINVHLYPIYLRFNFHLQDSIFEWARDHRTHHKYADTDADPHNAERGLFYSHMGWLCVKKLPEVIEGGKRIDLSDLYKDPVVMFQKK